MHGLVDVEEYLGGLIDRYGARTCLPLGCLMAAAALVRRARDYHERDD